MAVSLKAHGRLSATGVLCWLSAKIVILVTWHLAGYGSAVNEANAISKPRAM
jgi:hypothetical protein